MGDVFANDHPPIPKLSGKSQPCQSECQRGAPQGGRGGGQAGKQCFEKGLVAVALPCTIDDA